MKKNVLLLLIVGFAVSFVGCNKLGTDPSAKSQFVLNTDVAALQQRITIVDEPVDFVSTLTNKSTAATTTYSLLNTWNLEPPSAEDVSASSVAWDGINNQVYVGFHLRGNLYFGEILKISDATTKAPDVTWGLTSDLVDVNDLEVYYDGTKNWLYMAGESHARGAEALRIDLSFSGTVTPELVGMPVYGASANSVTVIKATDDHEYLWVSSGGTNLSNSKGGLIELDFDLALASPVINATINDGEIESAYEAKQFDAEGALGLWIYGNGNQTIVNVFSSLTDPAQENRDDYTALAITDPDGQVTDWGKNAVEVDLTNEVGYVALGLAGAYQLDLVSTPGSTLFNYDDDSNTGLANGITTDGTYVYVAHGADGLIVLKASNMEEVGRWNGPTGTGDDVVNYDDNGSCNYVAVGDVASATEGDITTTTTDLFVAFGRGGLMMLQFVVEVDNS